MRQGRGRGVLLGDGMPAGKKQAAAKVKEEPTDDAGVKRERPAEEVEGGAAAKHVKAEPKIEPHRSGARGARVRRGRLICAWRAARGTCACVARGGGRRAAQQQRPAPAARLRARAPRVLCAAPR